MATKRLGAAKKRRRNSTLIANPRRKKRKRKLVAKQRKTKPLAKKRKANPLAKKRKAAPKRRRKLSLAKRRNPAHKRTLARRSGAKRRRRNPGGFDMLKKMVTDLPILEIAVAGAGAIFLSNVVAGIPVIKKKVGEMKEGFAKDAAGGLIGPAATFAAALAVMHFGGKSAKVKKIGQFMAYAALFQATNALVGAQVQKAVDSTLKTISGDKEVEDTTTVTTTTEAGGGFGGAWIGQSGVQYGGLLGAGAYFQPDDADFGGAWMTPDNSIKIAGFGGFN